MYTAAVIGYLDQSWLATNKEYGELWLIANKKSSVANHFLVNTLVRDFANPSEEDTVSKNPMVK